MHLKGSPRFPTWTAAVNIAGDGHLRETQEFGGSDKRKGIETNTLL